ncbi:rho family-interacting cell polarization regulator 2-like isoform X1 [Argopecten irradians]|uniref:rho family-interacting cell polarization regulator 2-like isoform X1 n=2 Tax=Argopecten irradians TaxID=31199 RepID=UPI00371F8E99
MSKKLKRLSQHWKECVPTEYTVTPVVEVFDPRGPRVTRHASFLHLGRGYRHKKDPFSMTRKDPFQTENHVLLENINNNFQVPRGPSLDLPPSSKGASVFRSQSFGGMSTRSAPNLGSPSGSTPVLGETLRGKGWAKSPQASRTSLGGSSRKSPKVPKVPRPNRAFLMFDSVRRGIREFIEATRDDIDQLHSRGLDATSTAQGRLHETDKQIKAAERYMKRLEFHLSKIEELHDCYLVQQQLREGTKTMQRAYILSPAKRREVLASVRYGMKECSQTMCAIEAQLEAMLGTFNCKLKGMAGFARLCPGDVFEISLKHGAQKWKSKGRVEKTGAQRWDNAEYTFKALVGDIIHIKGVEARSFKSVLLGQKSCDTRDLFSSNPQLMTVSINTNGSLKLSIVITWNPLDGVEESMSYFEVPMRPANTPRRRPVSVLALNGELNGSYMSLSDKQERRFSTPLSLTKDDNFVFRTSTASSASAHSSPYPSSEGRLLHRDSGFSSAINLPTSSPVQSKKPLHSPPSPPLETRSPPLTREGPPTHQSPVHPSSPVLSHSTLPSSVFNHLHFPVASSQGGTQVREEPQTVEDALTSLQTVLEDFHGQYRELERLEDVVVTLEHVLRKESRCSSRSSSISISIESALEAFDFLNTEETATEEAEPQVDQAAFDNIISSPESTAKTADSGIESLAKRLSEDTQLGSSEGSSPLPPTTGNDQVDHALIYHLVYCERLLESLGNFGPLKCREIYALDKLQKQAEIIESLIKVASTGAVIDLLSVMTELSDDKSLREFWARCTDHNVLYVHPEKLVASLEQKYGPQLQSKYNKEPKKVLRHLVMRILDVPSYDPDKIKSTCVVTLHQFMRYFTDEGGFANVDGVASDLNMIEQLCSTNPDAVIKTILSLRDDLPSSPCLKVMGALLVSKSQEIQKCLASYLNLINMKSDERTKAIVVFVEGLEDKTSEIRAGSCIALSLLEATEGIDQLAYICHSDISQSVRLKAKEALVSLGEEGRRAYEEGQLTSHGFQGVHVRK